MNLLALFLLMLVGSALFLVPRRWAPIPLLAAACYMTMGEGVEIGSFSLPAYRIMLGLGLIRVVLRREHLVGGLNTIDRLMIAWSGWVFLASFFHLSEPGSGPVYATGYIMNIALSYFLVRVWCQSLDEAKALFAAIGILLAPLAFSMLLEHVLQKNFLSILGGISDSVYVRDGKIRSQGPFQHPILAGTVGSVCVAYMFAVWNERRAYAVVGILAATAMVLSSGSSGPLMSFMITILAVLAWRVRQWIWAFRYAALALYVLLEIVMPAPAYYIISKIDLTGSSTGWHRGRLIEAAIEYFPEWWLFGTDYTIHWIGLSNWSERHSDITNYYLSIGVVGGFAAMALTIAMMWCGFVWVGRLVRDETVGSKQNMFAVWCLGAGLFSHAASSLSVAYFDQSVVFFWLNISLISAVYSGATADKVATESSQAALATQGQST